MEKSNRKYASEVGFLRCPVLASPEMLSETVMREKAIKLARIEKTIVNLVRDIPDRFQAREMVFTNNKKRVGIYLDTPLFYQETNDVFFNYYRENNMAYNRDRELSKKVNVNTRFSLYFQMFSDLETKEVYERFVHAHPKRHFYSAIETTYFFDEEGHFAKIIELPEEIKIDRKPLLEDEPVYQSTMTAEDFLYAERALTVIKDRIEDYLKWSRQPQSSDVN